MPNLSECDIKYTPHLILFTVKSYRKNYARSVESMQASLDIEVKARADSMRAKKKFETQLNDVEMQLENSHKNLAEQNKMVKKFQVTIKVCFHNPL